MKTNITIFCLTVVMSGCAIKPVPITGVDGNRGYFMDCSSGIEACYQESVKLCPDGYDIIDHSIKTSKLIPNYGENPMIVSRETLTIKCK